jgi:hypothetical protein
MNRKRRALVLVDESAKHPFLASLPPHVRQVARDLDRRSTISGPGWRQFISAYCASFVAIVVFIA